jgi:hypothetical protein
VSEVAAEKSLFPSDPEDIKLITLARAALARVAAQQGAAVRDSDGRTYAAASVELDHLRLSAIAVAVAMAVSSGAEALEAVALVGEDGPSVEDLEITGDLANDDAMIWWTDPAGRPKSAVELS